MALYTIRIPAIITHFSHEDNRENVRVEKEINIEIQAYDAEHAKNKFEDLVQLLLKFSKEKL